MLPGRFTEQQVRVYCKRLDSRSLKAAWELDMHACTILLFGLSYCYYRYFSKWCSTKPECVTPKEETDQIYWDDDDAQVTPYNTPFGTPVKNSPLQPTERDASKKFLDFEDTN